MYDGVPSRARHRANCPAVRMILPNWSDHPEQIFSYKVVQSKKFCLPAEKFHSLAKTEMNIDHALENRFQTNVT